MFKLLPSIYICLQISIKKTYVDVYILHDKSHYKKANIGTTAFIRIFNYFYTVAVTIGLETRL